MTSYPKRKDKFVAWSRAMVEGSTVDKPSYPGTTRETKRRSKRTGASQRRRTRRSKRAKKD